MEIQAALITLNHIERLENEKKIVKDFIKTSNNYDGRYNSYFNQSLSQAKSVQLYQKIQSLKYERKVEPTHKLDSYKNIKEQEKYKKIDILI